MLKEKKFILDPNFKKVNSIYNETKVTIRKKLLSKSPKKSNGHESSKVSLMSKISTRKLRRKLKSKKQKNIAFSLSNNLYTVNRILINKKNQYVKSRYLDPKPKKKKKGRNTLQLLHDYNHIKERDYASFTREENKYNIGYLKDLQVMSTKRKRRNIGNKLTGRNRLKSNGEKKIFGLRKKRRKGPLKTQRRKIKANSLMDIYGVRSLERKRKLNKRKRKAKSVSFKLKNKKNTNLKEIGIQVSKPVVKKKKEEKKIEIEDEVHEKVYGNENNIFRKKTLEKIEETESEEFGTKPESEFEGLKEILIDIEEGHDDDKKSEKSIEIKIDSFEEVPLKPGFKERTFRKFNVDGKINHDFEKNYNDIFDQKRDVYLNALNGSGTKEKKFRGKKKAKDYFPVKKFEKETRSEKVKKRPPLKVIKKPVKKKEPPIKIENKIFDSDIDLNFEKNPETEKIPKNKESEISLKLPNEAIRKKPEKVNDLFSNDLLQEDLRLPEDIEKANNKENLFIPGLEKKTEKSGDLHLPGILAAGEDDDFPFKDPINEAESGKDVKNPFKIEEEEKIEDMFGDNKNKEIDEADIDIDDIWGDKSTVKVSDDPEVENLNDAIGNAFVGDESKGDVQANEEKVGLDIFSQQPEIDKNAPVTVIEGDPDFELNDDDLDF